MGAQHTKMRILLIEDDTEVSAHIKRGLEQKGHEVVQEFDGASGLAHAEKETFDVLVIDRMLPELDGLSIITKLRASNDQTPALILSALSEVDDRVEGLQAGGDDYLVKPFEMVELVARLEVIARRGQPANHSEIILTAEDLSMNVISRKVVRGDKTIPLQAREFKLLEYLLRNKNKIVTRTMLLQHVWEYHFDPQTNVIDVHISRLRQKIDLDHDTSLIVTVRGSGYTISDSSAESAA
jgi:two-component system OmpR family response regulator